METISINGTAPVQKRGPGRPRKDGSAPQPRTESSVPRKKKDKVEAVGVQRFLHSDVIREFLLLPEEVQTSIRALVRYEDTTSVEFDLG